MSKKCYRFFGGLLTVQKNWLNKMAEKGYRLIRTGKLLYEFEKCKPGQVQYCVEFIGQKSKANAEDYHDFLEEMGYSVFYKNINLNYSVGKVRWRPWAEIGGRVATNTTTFNRELLIVEKENDGKPIYGKYGMLRKQFLKEHRLAKYQYLLLTGKLTEHLNQIDQESREQVEMLMEQMAEKQGVTEELKVRNQMKWVRLMNNIKASAEEMVLREILYI